MIGNQYGKLTVLSREPNNKWQESVWKCRCECGKEKITRGKSLFQGKVKSCGCLHIESISKEFPFSDHFMYDAWLAMKARCYRTTHPKYPYYGACGVVVCERWRTSFLNFLEDMGERPEGMTLDRINNLGNYEKDNCRWATPIMQANNRRKRNSVKINLH